MNHGKSDAEKARCLNASYDQKTIQDRLRADRRATAVVRATRRNRQRTRNSNGKRGGPVSAGHAGKVYRRRFVSTRFAATLLADGGPCFAVGQNG